MSAAAVSGGVSAKQLLARVAEQLEALRATSASPLAYVPRAGDVARVAVLQDMLPVLSALAVHPTATPEQRANAAVTRDQARRQLVRAMVDAPDEEGVLVGQYRVYGEREPGLPWAGCAGAFVSVADAMAAAGHPAPEDWTTAPGVADFVFLRDATLVPRWTIHGPGAEAAYVELAAEQIGEAKA